MNATNQAAAEIMEILTGLPSPRHAAAAIATVRANIFLQAGGDSVAKVKKMIIEDDKAALELWKTTTDQMSRDLSYPSPMDWRRT